MDYGKVWESPRTAVRGLGEINRRISETQHKALKPVFLEKPGFSGEPSIMPTLLLRGPYITLAQALKAAGLADTGGQAKLLVRHGTVTVNGIGVGQPGRKLVAGDRFCLNNGLEWTLGVNEDRDQTSVRPDPR
jgi:ribosome-associated protein